MNGRREIESRRQQIEAICREHKVARLLVFGSVLREDFDPYTSDIDFLVQFMPGPEKGWTAEYTALQEAFEALFRRNIDLLPEDGIRNPYRIRSIQSSKELLYAA